MTQNQPAYSPNIVVQPVNQGQISQSVYPVGTATPVVYAYQTRPAGPVVYDSYRSCQSKFTGVVQIIIGICLIAFNATGIGLYAYDISFVGHGIWAGCMFIVTGSFGIVSARLKSKCTVITYMVLCIISICGGATVLGLGITGVVISSDGCDNYYYSYYYSYSYSWCEYNADAVLAMHVLIMVLGAFEAACALWGSVICCRSACSCCGGATLATTQPVQFVANNGIPMIIVGNPQLAGYSVPAGQIITVPTYPSISGQIVTASIHPGGTGQILTTSTYTSTQGQAVAAPAYNPTVGHCSGVVTAPADQATAGQIGGAPNYNTTVGHCSGFVTAPAYQATAGQIVAAPPYQVTTGQVIAAPPYNTNSGQVPAAPSYEGTTNVIQHSTDMSEEKAYPADLLHSSA